MSGAADLPRRTAARTADGLSREAWTTSRTRMAYDALLRRGLAPGAAWAAATALMGHWAIETGWGRSEWNGNVGNIKVGSGWNGPIHELTDGLLYRSYDTPDAGADDAVRLASETERYRAAWAYLVSTGDGRGWYDRLMRAGWHPWSEDALTTYASTWSRVRNTVGQTAPGAPAAGLSGWSTAAWVGLGAGVAWWAHRVWTRGR